MPENSGLDFSPERDGRAVFRTRVLRQHPAPGEAEPAERAVSSLRLSELRGAPGTAGLLRRSQNLKTVPHGRMRAVDF